VSNDNDFERVPDAFLPKQRAPALTRVLGSLAGWGMFFALTLGGLGFWAWGQFTSDGPLTQAKVVTIKEGSSRSDIAKLLQDEGVITDARVLNAATLVNGFRGGSLRPGEYEFQPNTSMAGVLNAISNGKVLTYKLTIPEGWTSQMALERVNSNEVLTGPAVTSVPEGAVIADTQVFRRGMTREKLVQDMQDAQSKLVEEMWAKRAADTVLKSKEEMVVLASIVEKETGKPQERPHVAGVFLNRLKKGMKLQSDPTIIYGIAGGAGKLDRALTRADIDGQTAYNTYQIDGLPPGPIAVPGRASLEAVVAPMQTDDLYFVADGTGGHAFAATLEAHNENVKKWRELQKQNGIQLPGEEPAVTEDPAAANEVQQTPLPEVQNKPAEPEVAEPANNDQPIAEAEKDVKKAQGVPQPAEGEGAAQPVVAEPKAAEPPPLPVQKKPKPAVVAEAQPQTPVVEEAKKPELKPGSVIKIGAKLVPIPLLKKAKP
jgi:UPF0755 protein